MIICYALNGLSVLLTVQLPGLLCRMRLQTRQRTISEALRNGNRFGRNVYSSQRRQ